MELKTAMYVKQTCKPFADAVVSVLKSIEQRGWSLFQVYDLQERLAAKGFIQPPITVIEICAAKHADKMLRKNQLAAMCMPCRIAVVQQEQQERQPGRVVIAAMMPSILPKFFPEIREEDIQQLQQEVQAIIDGAA